MEIFLKEHGESILYAIIGIIMVMAICLAVSKSISYIFPEYKKDISKDNRYQIEKDKYKRPIIIADEVIYAEYGNEKFNCMDYIKAKDYKGEYISDKVKIYGKVDVNKKGVYRLRCTVTSYFNLACTKYINVIVE